MTTKPTYRVATAGLDERDVRLIDIVFRHSQYNAVLYVLVPVTTDGQADILIINPFEADGLRTLSRIRARGQSTPLITAVPVGMKSPARHVIHVERLTLQLLPVLNQLVETDFGSPAPQVFRMTDPHGRRVDRSALGQRLDRSTAVVVNSRVEPEDTVESVASLAIPSTLSAETGIPTTVTDTTMMAESGFAGSTVITTLSPQSGFHATVKAVPMPPQSILNQPDDVVANVNRYELPSADSAPTVAATQSLPDNSDMATVLVVDDSPTVRKQMQQALGRMGLTCIAVAGGREALRELESRSFAMALVDVVMGDMDGYQLTREIRRRAPHVPVIILTSRSSPFDLARGALSGCSSYLVKPVPLKRLQSVVSRRLRKFRESNPLDNPRQRRQDGDGDLQSASPRS